MSPFARDKPLQFWFFMAFVEFSVGVGALCRQFVGGGEALVFARTYFSGAFGLALGVAVALRLFRGKFAAAAHHDFANAG